MKRIFAMMAAVAAGLAMTGCSHNPVMMGFGKVVKIGNIEYGELSYVNGMYILDVSRENSSWELEVDEQTGIQVDAEAGTVKGVKRIKRTIGKQISGNLVDLAKKDKQAARMWVNPEEELKRQKAAAKAKGQGNQSLNTVVPPAADPAK